MSDKIKAVETAIEALLVEYKLKETELAKMRIQIERFGISVASATTKAKGKRKRTNKKYPAITLDAVKEFIGGKDGVPASVLAKKFGLNNWNKWRKPNHKHFAVSKVGTKRIWNLK